MGSLMRELWSTLGSGVRGGLYDAGPRGADVEGDWSTVSMMRSRSLRRRLRRDGIEDCAGTGRGWMSAGSECESLK